jgi:hypothetical protein
MPFPKSANIYEYGAFVTAKLLACAFPEEIPSGTVRVCANACHAFRVIAQEQQTDEVLQRRNLHKTENEADNESGPPKWILNRVCGDDSYSNGGVRRKVTEDRNVEKRHRAEPEQPQAKQCTFGDPHGQLLLASVFKGVFRSIAAEANSFY